MGDYMNIKNFGKVPTFLLRNKKKILYYISVLAFVFIFPNFSAAGSSELSIFDKVEGYWIFHKKYPAGCKDDWTRIEFIENNSRARFESTKPIEGRKGEKYTIYYYKVKGYDENSITLFLEKEDRKTKSGALITWVLVLVDDNTFVWRIAHWPNSLSNKSKNVWFYRRIRCQKNQ
jgi:hypothetical protein